MWKAENDICGVNGVYYWLKSSIFVEIDVSLTAERNKLNGSGENGLLSNEFAQKGEDVLLENSNTQWHFCQG